jgi:hypothetical protein
MPWYQIDFSDGKGLCRDDILAREESEARTQVESMGFTVHHIRVKRVKTLIAPIFELIDRLLRPRKYDPETAIEYELERVRKKHPDLEE